MYFRMKLASFSTLLSNVAFQTNAKLSPFHDDIIYNIDFVGDKADLLVPGIDLLFPLKIFKGGCYSTLTV